MRKTNTAMAICLAILLVASFGMAQSHSVRGKIPFEFNAGGKVLSAGEYDFVYDASKTYLSVRGGDKKQSIFVPIVTLLAAATHTTPRDAHVVFDKIGNNYFLSEIWISGIDGIDLLSTKEKHSHEVVNIPNQ